MRKSKWWTDELSEKNKKDVLWKRYFDIIKFGIYCFISFLLFILITYTKRRIKTFSKFYHSVVLLLLCYSCEYIC